MVNPGLNVSISVGNTPIPPNGLSTDGNGNPLESGATAGATSAVTVSSNSVTISLDADGMDQGKPTLNVRFEMPPNLQGNESDMWLFGMGVLTQLGPQGEAAIGDLVNDFYNGATPLPQSIEDMNNAIAQVFEKHGVAIPPPNFEQLEGAAQHQSGGTPIGTYTAPTVISTSGAPAVLGSLGAMDVGGLICLALAEAAKGARSDLQDIMGQMKCISAAKKAGREQIAKMREIAGKFADKTAGQPIGGDAKSGAVNGVLTFDKPVPDSTNPQGYVMVPGAYVLAPQTKTEGNTQTTTAFTKGALDMMIEKAQGDLESMSDLNDELSTRLQIAMDRMTRCTTAQSNCISKLSQAGQSLTQNLK